MNDENPTVILSNIGDILPQVNNMTEFLEIYDKQTTTYFDLNSISEDCFQNIYSKYFFKKWKKQKWKKPQEYILRYHMNVVLL